MKKCVVLIVLVIITMGLSSCTTIYEKAYEIECLYKAKKEQPDLVSGSLEKYERKFLEIYESMDAGERARYKTYRERENKRIAREIKAIKKAESEAIELLNN